MKAKRVNVRIEVLGHGKGLALPDYQTPGAAGMDLVAAVAEDAPIRLRPKARALVPTGLVMQLPAGYEAQVRPRSGLAIKHGITVLNAPGTIDADYRGEVMVILANLGGETFTVRRGERIAQLVVQPVVRAALALVAKTSRTQRGSGGFGSTGRSTTAAAGAKGKPKRQASAKKKPVPAGSASAKSNGRQPASPGARPRR